MKHIKISALALILSAISPKMTAQNVTIHKQGGVGYVYETEQVDSVVYFPIGDAEPFPAPEEESTNTLWSIIQQQPNLKKFVAILEAANYYSRIMAPTNLKLSQLLDGSMPVNVYAPDDNAITAKDYEVLLSLAGTDGWKLQQEFVFNHIGLQESDTAANGNKLMLNGKIVHTDAYNPAPASEKAAEGKLFTVSSQIPYQPNMKEYLQDLAPDCTQAQKFMKEQEKLTDADRTVLSVPCPNSDRRSLYEIIPIRDMLAQQYLSDEEPMRIKGFGANLADERASYDMITPTDAVWNDARAKLGNLYKYAHRYQDKHKGDMGFTGNDLNINVLDPDSLFELSMGADILVSLLGKTTGDQQTKLSNGTAYAASEWPVPAAEYMPDVEVEIEHSRTTSIVYREEDGYYIIDQRNGGSTLSELEVQKQITDVFYNTEGNGSYHRIGADSGCRPFDNDKFAEITDRYGRVSNDNFYYLTGQTANTGPRVEIKLVGNSPTARVPQAEVMSGKYDIQVVLVPYWYTQLVQGSASYYIEKYPTFDYYIEYEVGNIPDEWRNAENGQINHDYIKSIASKFQYKFNASLTFNSDGTEKSRQSLAKNIVYDGQKVDTITVAEDFEFPTSYKNVRSSYPVLAIEGATISSAELNPKDPNDPRFVRDIVIDKIILKSKGDGNEIIITP